MKAELVPDNGAPPIPITRDVTVVGRRDYCDIKIDDASLSKRHCVLVKTDGLLVIRDLASTNGTKVKGQRIRWAALLPDDRITLGSVKLRVYLGPDEVPAPSELPRGAARPAARPAPANLPAQAVPAAGVERAVPVGFGAPTPSGIVPVAAEDYWDEEENDGDDDSGWRHKIHADPDGDDVIIELD